MSIREEQCNKVCRMLDDVLANRPTERDSLIIAVRKAFEALELFGNSEQLSATQPEKRTDKRTKTHACDLIDRQEAIKVATKFRVTPGGEIFEAIRKTVRNELEYLPAAQPKPAIAISWLMKEIERLESYENSFAVLDALRLKALIKRWESEQND